MREGFTLKNVWQSSTIHHCNFCKSQFKSNPPANRCNRDLFSFINTINDWYNLLQIHSQGHMVTMIIGCLFPWTLTMLSILAALSDVRYMMAAEPRTVPLSELTPPVRWGPHQSSARIAKNSDVYTRIMSGTLWGEIQHQVRSGKLASLV